jgi:hypothetical protein
MLRDPARGGALRVRGAVLLAFRTVGRNPFRRACQPTLLIAQSALQAVSEHMKSGAVFVCGDGIGHWVAFACCDSALCTAGQ